MKIQLAVLLLAVFLFMLPFDLGAVEPEGDSVGLRRFALVVGANNGGRERITLQYAGTDARSFADVMRELGGIGEQDLILLLDPSLEDFNSGLDRLKTRVTEDRSSLRKELIIYYSGHSDEAGLLLGDDRYGYAELRAEIGSIPTDVRIAILDSCASGALTRAKGGARAPAFMVDVANTMKGHAFLTSSSADEASQESDTIRASFFTHYLITGLRGAADSSGEGIVTLSEAYNFAYHETLASTEKSQYGPQHPNWDISLTGTGDIVLTDLRNSTSGLVFSKDIAGRIFVRTTGGALVAELNKPAGKEVMLALEPGTYRVVQTADDRLSQTEVAIAADSRSVLTQARLQPLEAYSTVTRGGEILAVPSAQPTGPAELPEAEAESAEGGELTGEGAIVFQPFGLSIVPELPLRGLRGATVDHSVSLNMVLGYSANIRGLDLSLVGSIVSENVAGMQASLLGNFVGSDVTGFQTAGLFNYVGGDVRYVQTSGGANYVRGASYGLQAATLFNFTAGNVGGLQASSVANIGGGSVKGVQAAGVANLAYGGFIGSQLGGVANVSLEQAIGLQASSVINVHGGTLMGSQLAAVANYGRHVKGVQMSLINVAKNVDGVQTGLVNIGGTVRGTQIGLINISEKLYGIPVGLINFEKEGQQHLDVWRTNEKTTHVAFRLGSRYLYTIITGAYRPGETKDAPVWSYGVGMGGRIPLSAFFINMDVLCQSVQEGFDSWYILDNLDLLPEFRLYAGLETKKGFGVFAGLSYLVFVPGWYPDPQAEPADQGRFHLRPRPIFGLQL